MGRGKAKSSPGACSCSAGVSPTRRPQRRITATSSGLTTVIPDSAYSTTMATTHQCIRCHAPSSRRDSGRREPADLGGRSELPHWRSLFCSRENGSESVRRISDVFPVTSLSRESSERVRR